MNLVLHHIGIATKNIQNSINQYQILGYSKSEIIFDPIQKVNLCFLSRKNEPLLELVTPTSTSSPVNNILQKVGTSPYHFCYSVDNIELQIKKLKESGFKLISSPVPAVAFNGRLVCFLYHFSTGIIELLEK